MIKKFLIFLKEGQQIEIKGISAEVKGRILVIKGNAKEGTKLLIPIENVMYMEVENAK